MCLSSTGPHQRPAGPGGPQWRSSPAASLRGASSLLTMGGDAGRVERHTDGQLTIPSSISTGWTPLRGLGGSNSGVAKVRVPCSDTRAAFGDLPTHGRWVSAECRFVGSLTDLI